MCIHMTLQDWAVLDEVFHNSFTCPLPRNSISLTGTLRALCRLCLNISNPENGLVLNGTYMCFPQSLLTTFSCLRNYLFLSPECNKVYQEAQHQDKSSTSVLAEYKVDNNKDGSTSLRYLAMAFRSVR